MTGFRDTIDTIRLGVDVVPAEKRKQQARQCANSMFEVSAGRLALGVEKGLVDPIEAESALSNMEAARISSYGNYEVPEPVSERIARLVISGKLDPIAAENMLDDFGQSSFITAARVSTPEKQ